MYYENLENLPFRASMRRSVKGGHCWHDSYGSKIREFYIWLYAFLRSNIGKSFNDAYSILCKKYPNNIGWLNPKEQFKRRFEDSKYRRSRYYVDENGVIRYRRLRPPRKISILVPTAKARSTYRFKRCPNFIRNVLWILPYERRIIAKVTGRITFDEYIKIRNSYYWEETKPFLEEMNDSEYEIAWKGCRRYCQLRAEKKLQRT